MPDTETNRAGSTLQEDPPRTKPIGRIATWTNERRSHATPEYGFDFSTPEIDAHIHRPSRMTRLDKFFIRWPRSRGKSP